MTDTPLSKRERQMMDALFALGEGSAREVARAIREPDLLDSVRVTLAVLERKGHVKHRMDGRRNVYAPVQSLGKARRTAFERLTRTFFGGKPSVALIALLDISRDKLGDEELDALEQWVKDQARERRREVK